MSDRDERSPGSDRRAHVSAALESHGVAPGQAAALAKSLLDLVTVIGVDGCRAAFAAALDADRSAGARGGAATAEPAERSAAVESEVEALGRLLGSFAGELRRLDDALQQLGRQLARATGTASPKDPRALH